MQFFSVESQDQEGHVTKYSPLQEATPNIDPDIKTEDDVKEEFAIDIKEENL